MVSQDSPFLAGSPQVPLTVMTGSLGAIFAWAAFSSASALGCDFIAAAGWESGGTGVAACPKASPPRKRHTIHRVHMKTILQKGITAKCHPSMPQPQFGSYRGVGCNRNGSDNAV